MNAYDRNLLKAARFDTPSFIPVQMMITPACWFTYARDFLVDLIGTYPRLFPDHDASLAGPPELAPWMRAGAPCRDSWGCLWQSQADGLSGYVMDHPLKSWDDLPAFTLPDPACQNGWGPISWDAERTRMERQQAGGQLKTGSLRRGHTFMTYSFIRGYLNQVFDMMDRDPRALRLLNQIADFNSERVERFADLGMEWLEAPEDLGMETGPLLTPAQFKTFLKPCYQRMFSKLSMETCVVHVRCYGNIQPLIPELLNVGIDVLGVQDMVVDLDWLRIHLKQKVCIDINIDRRVLCFGQPDDVNRRIYQVISALGSKQGGLILHHELMPGCPTDNIRALLQALDSYSAVFS